MATQRSSFEKRERDRAKKAKADAKRSKRLQGRDDETEGDDDATATESTPQDVVLAQIAELHADYEAERIGYDEFEERKAELMAKLSVD